MIKNYLTSTFSGIIKIKDIFCVVSESNDIIVVNSNCMLSIIKDGIEL